MADEVAQKEEEEIEAMLDMIPNRDMDVEMDMETPYGSDDEEFDGLLLDAIQAVENQHMSHHGGGARDDRMDESWRRGFQSIYDMTWYGVGEGGIGFMRRYA